MFGSRLRDPISTKLLAVSNSYEQIRRDWVRGSEACCRCVNGGLRTDTCSVNRSSPGWRPQEASLWPLTHRQPPSPFPRIGRQSLRSLMGASP
jgi:hypothetical protein